MPTKRTAGLLPLSYMHRLWRVALISSSGWLAEIQKFAGALLGRKAKKGVYFTTSRYTNGAVDYASSIDAKIILIDGVRLTDLMITHNVGVEVAETYEIKKVNLGFFEE